jgi:hypothetical protein
MRVDHRRLHIRVPEVFAPGPQGDPLRDVPIEFADLARPMKRDDDDTA